MKDNQGHIQHNQPDMPFNRSACCLQNNQRVLDDVDLAINLKIPEQLNEAIKAKIGGQVKIEWFMYYPQHLFLDGGVPGILVCQGNDYQHHQLVERRL